jgi:type IV pilus assembly protein PilX
MHKKQQGIVLIISMIMLLMMTLLGVTAMKTSLMEEKMAGNTRDATLAFHAAETALRDTEVWLTNQGAQPQATGNNSNRVWTKNSMDPYSANAVSWWQEIDGNNKINQTWWQTHAFEYVAPMVNGVIPSLANVSSPPRSIIEEKQTVMDTEGMAEASTARIYYQVTARGTGGSDQARSLVQSTVVRRY